jgi:hypothetical protein
VLECRDGCTTAPGCVRGCRGGLARHFPCGCHCVQDLVSWGMDWRRGTSARARRKARRERPPTGATERDGAFEEPPGTRAVPAVAGGRASWFIPSFPSIVRGCAPHADKHPAAATAPSLLRPSRATSSVPIPCTHEMVADGAVRAAVFHRHVPSRGGTPSAQSPPTLFPRQAGGRGKDDRASSEYCRDYYVHVERNV